MISRTPSREAEITEEDLEPRGESASAGADDLSR
jgi:hypothetical protein